MIDFGQYIYADLIVKDLNVKSKEEAIEALVERVYQKYPSFAGEVPKEKTLEEIMHRESMQTTGLGQGKAFPHVRIEGWEKFVIVLGYCVDPINFQSLDDKPVNFICLMISSKEQPYLILQSMSNIIKFLDEVKNVRFLFENKSSQEIAHAFKTKDLKINQIVEAQDIMRPLKTIVKIDDSIEKIVKHMHLKKIDVLPVVDDEGRLKGQISCFNIFEHEVPDFFKQLHTVSFVRNIDPFEKFFKLQKDLKVKHYLKESCATVKHDATLIEIIFLLTVKNYPRLFVTRDERLVGVIDRFCILDRILFF